MKKTINKLKVGVIGVGALGKYHVNLYKQCEDVDIVGVFDVDRKQAESISKEYGVDVFDSSEALAEKADALNIVVPATHHYDVAMPLLKQGKHLLIEKPLAVTLKQGEEIVNTAKKNNLVLAVGHNERFNPAAKYIHGQADKTCFIEAHRLAKYPPPRPGLHRRGTEVSVVLDLMIHDLDLTLCMVDSDIERIDAVGMPVLSESEDIANVRIKFKNGCVANITASRVSENPMRRFRVFQTDAYVTLDFAKQSGRVYKKGPLGIINKQVPMENSNALLEELRNFSASVRQTILTGKVEQPAISGEEGLAALKLAVRIVDKIKKYNRKYGIYQLQNYTTFRTETKYWLHEKPI